MFCSFVCFPPLQDRIDGITQAADQFVDAGHFDADNIKAKQQQLVERYQALQDPMHARRLKLRDALRLQQFYRDVEDEDDWIREKEPIAASTNRGRGGDRGGQGVWTATGGVIRSRFRRIS